jgi:hypothetical protein
MTGKGRGQGANKNETAKINIKQLANQISQREEHKIYGIQKEM